MDEKQAYTGWVARLTSLCKRVAVSLRTLGQRFDDAPSDGAATPLEAMKDDASFPPRES